MTLFLVDSRPGAGDGIDVGVGTVDEDEADVGTALDDGVTPGYDFTNEGGAGAVIWTAVSTSGDEFSVPLQPGPVLKMLQAPGVVSVRRPDVIGQYMRSMQRTQYAQGEVRELLACALRDGNGRVVGFLEALNHEEAMAEQGSEGFDDDDKALMRVTATHMGAAVSRYVMVCTCRRPSCSRPWVAAATAVATSSSLRWRWPSCKSDNGSWRASPPTESCPPPT